MSTIWTTCISNICNNFSWQYQFSFYFIVFWKMCTNTFCPCCIFFCIFIYSIEIKLFFQFLLSQSAPQCGCPHNYALKRWRGLTATSAVKLCYVILLIKDNSLSVHIYLALYPKRNNTMRCCMSNIYIVNNRQILILYFF